MADRPLVYAGALARTWDMLHGFRDTVKALAQACADIISAAFVAAGGSLATPTSVVNGFVAKQQSSANLTIQLTAGTVYQVAQLDPSTGAYSDLNSGTDLTEGTTSVYQQGTYGGTASLAIPVPGSAGFAWQLVTATFNPTDAVRSGDPGNGVMPFFNSANPSQVLIGQAGGGGQLNTVRLGGVTITVTSGATNATAGGAVPPALPTVNGLTAVPLYLILTQNTTTTITNAYIARASGGQLSNGTIVPQNVAYDAPFLNGLVTMRNALNAPKAVFGVSGGGTAVGFTASQVGFNVGSVAFSGNNIVVTFTRSLGALGASLFTVICTADVPNQTAGACNQIYGAAITGSGATVTISSNTTAGAAVNLSTIASFAVNVVVYAAGAGP